MCACMIVYRAYIVMWSKKVVKACTLDFVYKDMKEGVNKTLTCFFPLRSAFLSALSHQLLNLAQLLPSSLSNNAHPQFLLTLRLLRCILIGLPSREVSYQSSRKLLQLLLTSFFALLKISTRTTLRGKI